MECKKCNNPLCDTDRKCISTPDYKPCPFCGESEALELEVNCNSYYVSCLGCETEGPPSLCCSKLESKEKAIERWNKRPSQDSYTIILSEDPERGDPNAG